MTDRGRDGVELGRREELVVSAMSDPSGVILVRAREHVVRVDEAQRYGGHDLGANPVEHMLVGLASASLVVLRLLGQQDIAARSRLTVQGRLNVDRVMGRDTGPVFDRVALRWQVDDPSHVDVLTSLLPYIAARRPGQALIDAAAVVEETVTATADSRPSQGTSTLDA
jgi:uncharacterized OsmC-like protein